MKELHTLFQKCLNFKSNKYVANFDFTSATNGVRVSVQERIFNESGLSEFEHVEGYTFYIGENYGDSLDEMLGFLDKYGDDYEIQES